MYKLQSASPFSSRFTSSSTSQLISIIHTLIIHHSFTPGSKPTFSTNPFYRSFLLPTGRLMRAYEMAQVDLSDLG